jgi:hypothetical protein
LKQHGLLVILMMMKMMMMMVMVVMMMMMTCCDLLCQTSEQHVFDSVGSSYGPEICRGAMGAVSRAAPAVPRAATEGEASGMLSFRIFGWPRLGPQILSHWRLGR